MSGESDKKEQSVIPLKRHTNSDFYKEVFHKSRDGFVKVDTSGKILDANDAFCEMLGYSLEELRDMENFYNITPKRWHKREQEIWTKMLKRGYSGIYEKEYVKKNGTIFPVELQSYTVFDEGDKPRYLWGIARNIAERREAEEFLIENEERYRTLFETAKDAIFIIDKERFIDCNREAIRLFGCEDRKDILDRTIQDFSPEHQPVGIESKIKAASVIEEALSGVPQRFYWKHKKKNDRLFDSEVSLNCVEIGGRKVIQAIVRDVTDIMDFQRRISRSEEKYRNLFEKAPLGIFVADDESNIVDANPASEKILGYSRDELIGKNASQLIHPDDLERTSLIEMRNLIKKGVGNIERRYIAKDGRSLFTEVGISRLIDESGDGRHMVIFRDVTEKKKAANSLKESETKARSILNASPLAIVLLDRNGMILDTNEEHASRLNRKREEILGECVWDLLPESVRSGRKEKVEKVFETGKSFLGEDERDGIWNEYRIEPVRFEREGEIDAVVVEALDITERKKVEIALRISEERFRSIFEHSPLGISIFDPEGRLLRINNAIGKMLGYTNEEIMEKGIEGISHPEDMKMDLDKLEELKQGKIDSYSLEKRFYHKRGDMIWGQLSVSSVKDERGNMLLGIGMFIDTTERKKAEDEVSRSEEKYRQLAESANNIIILHDLKGRIQYINQYGMDFLGFPERKIIGRKIDNVIAGYSTKDEKNLTKKIKNGRIKKELFELKLNTSGTEKRFLEIIKTPIEKDGIVEGILIIGHDITERKRAQKELEGYLLEMKIIADMVVRSSHMKSVDDICKFLGENIHSLNRDSYLAISLYNPDSNSIGIKGVFGFEGQSDEMVKNFLKNMENLNFDPDQTGESSKLFVSGKLDKVPGGLYDILDGKIPKDLCRMVEEMLEIEEAYTVGFALGKRPYGGISIFKKKGTKIKFRSVIETLANHSSVIIHQKQAESKLNRSEREKNLILNTTEEMFAYYDTDLRIQWLNPASAESMGLKSEDMIGKYCYHFWNGSDQPCDDCPVLVAKKTKKPQKIRKRTPDGRYWYLRGYPVLDDRGEVSALIEVGLDITDRVEAEIELEEEKERAEFYLDLLGHDLGNIHQGLSGALQLTIGKIGNEPKVRPSLDIACRAVEDSMNLTRDVMLLSRIRKDRPVLEILNLRSIIDKALDRIGRMFPDKEIRADLEILEKYILAEPLLKEAFVNLFHNALKLQDNHPRLEVDSREENGWIKVSVCDWGPGIPDEMKKDLFKKYGIRGEKTRTGLGLSIVKSIVERYHGTIDIEDRIEGDHSRGACFVMKFPGT